MSHRITTLTDPLTRALAEIERARAPGVIEEQPANLVIVKRRGRRPNWQDAELSRIDASVGSAAWLMWCWGYSLRRQICPAVAAAAKTTLGRVWSKGLMLSEERIEQLMEQWASSRARAAGLTGRSMPSRFTVTSRRLRAPAGARSMGPTALACLLLKHGGRWPADGPELLHGDLDPTPETAAAYRPLTRIPG